MRAAGEEQTTKMLNPSIDSYRCRFQLLDGRRQVPMSSVAAAAARVTALAGVAQEGRISDARQHVQRTRGSSVSTRREVIRIITTNVVAPDAAAAVIVMMTIAAVAAPARVA